MPGLRVHAVNGVDRYTQLYHGFGRAWRCQAVRHSTHLWGIARLCCCVAYAAQGPRLAQQSPETRGTAHCRGTISPSGC